MPSPNNDARRASIRFFHAVACRHLTEMRLLFNGGKLWKKEGWRPVVEHCLIQVAAADVLAELLGLPEEDKCRLMRAAAVHDWKKRMERYPAHFTTDEQAKAEMLLNMVQPDE